MKASELRIGNYVQSDGDIVAINGFSPLFHLERCNTDEGCNLLIDIINNDGTINLGWECEIKDANPIPITDEWLLKLGFTKPNDCWYHFIDFNDDFDSFKISFSDDLKTYFLVGYLSKHIQYVHQLQNLYFALTGKELTLKTIAK